MDDESDSSICGFDPENGTWVVARRRKKKSKATFCSAITEPNAAIEKNEHDLLAEERNGRKDDAGNNVGDRDELQCNVCQSRFNVRSQGVPYSAYRALKDHCNFLSWICGECKESLKPAMLQDKPGQLAEAIATQTDAIKNLSSKCETTLAQLRAEQKALAEVVRITTSQLGELQKASVTIEEASKRSFADIVKGSCDEVIATLSSKIMTMSHHPTGEVLEKERRKCNIVVHNLPEPQASSRRDAVDSDCRLLMGIFKDVMHLNTRIATCYRIGRRQEDKPRMVVATFESEAMKLEVLRYAPELQHSGEWAMLYLNPDMTRTEREEAKTLREELRNRRKNCEQNITIRNKKIVVVPGTDEKYKNRQQARQQLKNAHSPGESETHSAYSSGAIQRLANRVGNIGKEVKKRSMTASEDINQDLGESTHNAFGNDKCLPRRQCHTEECATKTTQD